MNNPAGSTVHDVACECGFCKAGFTRAKPDAAFELLLKRVKEWQAANRKGKRVWNCEDVAACAMAIYDPPIKTQPACEVVEPYDSLPSNPRKPTLLEWLAERRANCFRIARDKYGAEKEGWIEDGVYFVQAERLAAAVLKHPLKVKHG